MNRENCRQRVSPRSWEFKLHERAGRYKGLLALLVALILAVAFRQYLSDIGSFIAQEFGDLVHWFISLPVFLGFRPFQYMLNPYVWPHVTSEFGVHLKLVAEAVFLSLLIAIPLGIILHRLTWAYLPVFVVLDGIYAIPSLALFALLLPFTHLSDATVLIPMVAYAQFILVRNVVAGLNAVPTEAKEAARGMGMNRWQILVRAELPLALPVIVAGARIATVASIGIAAIAALVAIPDLGALFFDATTNAGVNAFPSIEAGAFCVIVLALGADLMFRVVERYIPANRIARASRQGDAHLEPLSNAA